MKFRKLFGARGIVRRLAREDWNAAKVDCSPLESLAYANRPDPDGPHSDRNLTRLAVSLTRTAPSVRRTPRGADPEAVAANLPATAPNEQPACLFGPGGDFQKPWPGVPAHRVGHGCPPVLPDAPLTNTPRTATRLIASAVALARRAWTTAPEGDDA